MKSKILVLAAGLLLGTVSLPLAANITQTIFSNAELFSVNQGDTIDLSLFYSSNEENLTGVGLTLSFDSRKLEFTGFTEEKQEGLLAADTAAKPETSNKDADDKTDAEASIAWMSVKGEWPGEAQLPATLGVAHFKVLDTEDSVTNINIIGSAAAQSNISTKSVAVNIGQGNTLGLNSATGGGGSLTWLHMPFLLLALLTSAGLFRKPH